jgi:hypothetical protein
VVQAPQEAEVMAQQGRNERCPCGSRRKVKHCYGVRRGPSEAELAKAFLHQQARAAALVLEARSNAEVAALSTPASSTALSWDMRTGRTTPHWSRSTLWTQ